MGLDDYETDELGWLLKKIDLGEQVLEREARKRGGETVPEERERAKKKNLIERN